MNKKIKKNESAKISTFIISTFLLFIVVVSLLMSLGYAINLSQHVQMRDICEKYREQYKFDSHIEGNFWSWDGSYDCYIYTVDGLKIHYYDFNIAQNVEVKKLQ